MSYCALRWKNPDLEPVLEELKAAGWDGWEGRLPLDWLGAPNRLRKICKNTDMPMVVFTAAGSPDNQDWENVERNKRRMEYAAEVGFLPDEINQLADHRSVLVIKKAMEFDKLTKKVAPKKKAVKKVPKVQKAGRGTSKEDTAAEALKAKRTRLRKSGKQQDAASLFYDML
jgi:hypothetical protein